MSEPTLSIGVCSWSLQVGSIDELEAMCAELGLQHVQIACGDPHHAAWREGDGLPERARSSKLQWTGAMIGFPGEDYTTPATIQATGGFGDPTTRQERLERFRWAVQRTIDLGLSDLMCHAGFIPDPGSPDRKAFLNTLAQAASIAGDAQVTLALETGQETADLLKLTLDELRLPNLKVNFDPANMLLYDKGDPIKAVELLAPYVRSVHLKDAKRPRVAGQWGEEVPLGQGQANIPLFLKKLRSIGFENALVIEREVGNQKERLRDIAHAVRFIKECLA